jgi:hypothetical protein
VKQNQRFEDSVGPVFSSSNAGFMPFEQNNSPDQQLWQPSPLGSQGTQPTSNATSDTKPKAQIYFNPFDDDYNEEESIGFFGQEIPMNNQMSSLTSPLEMHEAQPESVLVRTNPFEDFDPEPNNLNGGYYESILVNQGRTALSQNCWLLKSPFTVPTVTLHLQHNLNKCLPDSRRHPKKEWQICWTTSTS